MLHVIWIIMKKLFFLSLFLISNLLQAKDFELEIFSTRDKRDLNLFEYSDILTYRQFKGAGNWKDSLGDWGKINCAGSHTIIKGKGTVLKNYCKGTNKDGNVFWLMMDRESDNFDTGIGKIRFEKGTGKFEKYEGINCVYAISFLPKGEGSFIKAKCKLNK